MKNFKRDLWLRIGLIFLTLAACGGILYWLSTDIVVQAQAVVAKRALSTERASLLAALADLKKNSAAVDAYQKQIDTLLPTRDQLIGIPHVLDGVARANQVGKDFNFEGATIDPAGGQLGYTGFRLGVQGGYSNLLSFLRTMELRSSQFLVALNDFDLTQSSGTYQLTAHGKLFFR